MQLWNEFYRMNYKLHTRREIFLNILHIFRTAFQKRLTLKLNHTPTNFKYK